MAKVRVPTLGIIGSADQGLAGMNELKAGMAALKVVVVEGATHGGDRGVLKSQEFLNAFREFIAAN